MSTNPGGEVADEVVKMMLSGTEMTVRLSADAAKNMLAISLALAKNHKKLSGKTNFAKMLKETRDIRMFPMTKAQFKRFQKEARKYKLLYSSIRDKGGKGNMIDVVLPVTELDRANMVFERIRYAQHPVIQQPVQQEPNKEPEQAQAQPQMQNPEPEPEPELAQEFDPDFDPDFDLEPIAAPQKQSVEEQLAALGFVEQPETEPIQQVQTVVQETVQETEQKNVSRSEPDWNASGHSATLPEPCETTRNTAMTMDDTLDMGALRSSILEALEHYKAELSHQETSTQIPEKAAEKLADTASAVVSAVKHEPQR